MDNKSNPNDYNPNGIHFSGVAQSLPNTNGQNFYSVSSNMNQISLF